MWCVLEGKDFKRNDNGSDAPSYGKKITEAYKRLLTRVKEDRASHPSVDQDIFADTHGAAAGVAEGMNHEVSDPITPFSNLCPSLPRPLL